MDEVFDQIGKLDNERLSENEKEEVKMKYLSNQYFKEGTADDIKNLKYNRLYPPRELTEDEIKQKEKEELYMYRMRPKPSVEPIQQLRLQIEEEEEKARIWKKKNEPFLKVKPIEEDLTGIKIFYKISPNPKTVSAYPSVQMFQSYLQQIDSGISPTIIPKIDASRSRRPSSQIAGDIRDSHPPLPRFQNKIKPSAHIINRSQKQLVNGNVNMQSQEKIKQNVAVVQPSQQQQLQPPQQPQYAISMFNSKQKDKRMIMSQTSLAKMGNPVQKDIYQKFNFQQTRAFTASKLTGFTQDIKYARGEAGRLVRIATDQFTSQQASMAPLQIFKDNEMIQQKNKYYTELAQSPDGILKQGLGKLSISGNKERNYDSDDSEKKPKRKASSMKIVATSTFLNNPNRNKHKVLKTGEKIYVIEQDG